MNEIKIENNVPMPSRQNSVYPLKEMCVGESFVIPLAKRASLACCWSRLKPMKFVSRTIAGTDTARVWRIK